MASGSAEPIQIPEKQLERIDTGGLEVRAIAVTAPGGAVSAGSKRPMLADRVPCREHGL